MVEISKKSISNESQLAQELDQIDQVWQATVARAVVSMKGNQISKTRIKMTPDESDAKYFYGPRKPSRDYSNQHSKSDDDEVLY